MRKPGEYFTAVDKTHIPESAFVYPYVTIPERDDSYLRHKTVEYVAGSSSKQIRGLEKELQPLWDSMLQEQLTEARSGSRMPRRRCSPP